VFVVIGETNILRMKTKLYNLVKKTKKNSKEDNLLLANKHLHVPSSTMVLGFDDDDFGDGILLFSSS